MIATTLTMMKLTTTKPTTMMLTITLLIISPTLFNFFISDFPDVAELSTNYADDLTILESGPDLSEVELRLNEDLRQIAAWAARKWKRKRKRKRPQN